MRANPERFPAGTTADADRLNRWTQNIVDGLKEMDATIQTRLDRYDVLANMNAVQVQQTAAWVLADPTLPTGNRLRDRNDYISGTAQHDVHFGQVIQNPTSVREYTPSIVRVTKPVDSGDPTIWARSFVTEPAGAAVVADASGTKRVRIRMELPTTRTCNCLVWEPYPALTHDLISVKLLTTSGETSLPLLATMGIETVMHGPQRFFFQEEQAWGAEVEVEGTADGSGAMDAGCWSFLLARIGTSSSSSFVYKLSNSAITGTVTTYGEGNMVVTKNSPSSGQVTVILTTPAAGPLSAIRRIEEV